MTKQRLWLCIIFSLFLLSFLPTTAYAREAEEDTGQTGAPYFFVEDGDPSVDHFPLKETDVKTTINGIIAETYVTQTYANEGTAPINASYVFPASTNVTIHGMTMQIGNQLVTAQIKEHETAKQEFEEAKSEGKSSSLLEQQRPNVFTMDVANIMPGDIVRIELHYTELISPVEGIYQFAFPTVVGPRYPSPSAGEETESDRWVASPYLEAGDVSSGKYNISVSLAAGVPITEIDCKSHDISVTYADASNAQITLSNPEQFAGDRDFILDYRLSGEEINCGLMLSSGEDENFFMLMVQPPERFAPQDIPPREYIFVLDVSGSMEGYPLDTAQSLIRDLVSNLRETDLFNVILFSGDSFQLSPRSLPATHDNIQKAIDVINQQHGGGWTELAPALQDAIDIPQSEDTSRSIVVITDGYISGEVEIFRLIRENLRTANFFSFGIGSSVNRYLVEGIAKIGLGESFVVTDQEDAAVTAQRFRTYIQSPLLTDIHVTFDGFDVCEVEPSTQSTLFAQKPIMLFGKWLGEPSGTIRITGKTGEQDYLTEIPVVQTVPQQTNNALRYLWARTRVDQLTNYGLTEYDPTIKEEITKLGLKYSMITPYTSFIAVLDTVRNPEGNSTDVDQPLPMPSQVSNLAIGRFTVGSEPTDVILLFMMLAIAAAGALLRLCKRRPSRQSL